jgi:hypothetical protein
MEEPNENGTTPTDVRHRQSRWLTGPKILGAAILLWSIVYITKTLARLGVVSMESLYPNPFARWVTDCLQYLPFSVVELAVGTMIVAAASWVILSLWRLYRGKRCVKAIVIRGLFGVFSVVFLLDFWGGLATATHVKDLSVDLDWRGLGPRPPESTTIAIWARELIAEINTNHEAYTHALNESLQSQNGFPGTIDVATHRGFERAFAELHVSSDYKVPFVCPKPLVLSKLLYGRGLLGYFSPHTQEVNYTYVAPNVQLPYAIAHEKAHALGIQREDEAAFLGYLACAYSDNEAIRQSGYWHVLTLLLLHLAEVDGTKYEDCLSRMSPEVRHQFDELFALSGFADRSTFNWIESIWNKSIEFGGDARGLSAYGDPSLLSDYSLHNGGSILPKT